MSKNSIGSILELQLKPLVRGFYFEEEGREMAALQKSTFFRQAPITVAGKELWLSREFAAVTPCDLDGEPHFTVPNLFHVTKPQNTSIRSAWGRTEEALWPVAVKAGTPEDVVEDLYRYVASNKLPIYQLLPKPGQEFEIDKPYQNIGQEDVDHDHGRKDLIDIVPVVVLNGVGVFRGSLERSHSHLLIR